MERFPGEDPGFLGFAVIGRLMLVGAQIGPRKEEEDGKSEHFHRS